MPALPYNSFMKKIFCFVCLVAAIVSCQSLQPVSDTAATAATENGQLTAATYGEAVATETSATPAAQVPQLLEDKDSLYLTLSGTALSSCTKKGCWMLVDLGSRESMRVTFKDYSFFVPKGLNGERIVMEGVLSRKISSPDELRHYAEDAGHSKKAIAAIQAADTVYAFEAVGVLVYPASK